jgi:hypothetical protein
MRSEDILADVRCLQKQFATAKKRFAKVANSAREGIKRQSQQIGDEQENHAILPLKAGGWHGNNTLELEAHANLELARGRNSPAKPNAYYCASSRITNESGICCGRGRGFSGVAGGAGLKSAVTVNT